MLEDLGSTGGTAVNGRRIERPAPLAQGDVVTLGVTEMPRAVGAGAGGDGVRRRPSCSTSRRRRPEPRRGAGSRR